MAHISIFIRYCNLASLYNNNGICSFTIIYCTIVNSVSLFTLIMYFFPITIVSGIITFPKGRIVPLNTGSLCFLDVVTEVKGRFAAEGKIWSSRAASPFAFVEDIPVSPLTLLSGRGKRQKGKINRRESPGWRMKGERASRRGRQEKRESRGWWWRVWISILASGTLPPCPSFLPHIHSLYVHVPINTRCTHTRAWIQVCLGVMWAAYIHIERLTRLARVYVCDCGLGTCSFTGDLLGKVIPFSRL